MKRDFTIVLVRPRDPNNIGAAARAMANFGLSDLRVVEPYEPSWQTAVVSAVCSEDILKNAKTSLFVVYLLGANNKTIIIFG